MGWHTRGNAFNRTTPMPVRVAGGWTRIRLRPWFHRGRRKGTGGCRQQQRRGGEAGGHPPHGTAPGTISRKQGNGSAPSLRRKAAAVAKQTVQRRLGLPDGGQMPQRRREGSAKVERTGDGVARDGQGRSAVRLQAVAARLAPKWVGRGTDQAAAWNTSGRERAKKGRRGRAPGRPRHAESRCARSTPIFAAPHPTGIGEFDRVYGAGAVLGGVQRSRRAIRVGPT